MAKNTGNKRTAIRHIRDGIKSNYVKDCKCAVCSTGEDLELHHYHTVSLILKNYVAKNNIPIDTDEQVLAMRDAFYKVHWYELVEDAVTLCNTHHKMLHKVYGKEPDLSTANKQKAWVQRFRDKLEGKDSQPNIETEERFAKLIINKNRSNRFYDLLQGDY